MQIWQPGMTLRDVERLTIADAMKFYHDNRQAVANALGISPRTLYDKLKEYEALDAKAQEEEFDRRAKRAEFLDRQRGIAPAETQGIPGSGSALQHQARNESRETIEEHTDGIPPIEFSDNRSEESLAGDTEEQPVSLQKRKEVQAMLPRQAAVGGQRGGR